MSGPATTPTESGYKFYQWHRAVLRVCLILFAAELGYCLIRLPWLSNWEMSYIPMHSPRLSDLWMSHAFRGALTGLGLLNIWVAVTEFSRLVRSWFARS